ncbi:hypothetical protein N7448_010339 [Penicillium atrosanguineum]|nr:hypothetical protein N7448_010339 [Penicillium atrosanguineum]
MPRQQRRAAPTPARSAPTRPTAAPARPAAAPQHQQQAPHSTAAAPPQQMQAPPQQSAGSGLFGQMASTAAGVAIGSSVGHAIGGFFSGGGSSAPAEPQQAAAAQPMDNDLWQSSANQSQYENPACANDARNFRNCMDENQGQISICGWYLDQLKACQSAAKPY